MLKTIPDLILEVKQRVRCIDGKTAMLERKENNGLLIDVREPSEFQKSSVQGAQNIPRGILEMQVVELVKVQNSPIYLHCATSVRAALSAEQLQRIGYENISVITCSIEEIKLWA